MGWLDSHDLLVAQSCRGSGAKDPNGERMPSDASGSGGGGIDKMACMIMAALDHRTADYDSGCRRIRIYMHEAEDPLSPKFVMRKQISRIRPRGSIFPSCSFYSAYAKRHRPLPVRPPAPSRPPTHSMLTSVRPRSARPVQSWKIIPIQL